MLLVATFGHTLPKRHDIWNTPTSLFSSAWLSYSNTVQLASWWKPRNGTSFTGSPGAYRSYIYCFICSSVCAGLSVFQIATPWAKYSYSVVWGILYFKWLLWCQRYHLWHREWRRQLKYVSLVLPRASWHSIMWQAHKRTVKCKTSEDVVGSFIRILRLVKINCLCLLMERFDTFQKLSCRVSFFSPYHLSIIFDINWPASGLGTTLPFQKSIQKCLKVFWVYLYIHNLFFPLRGSWPLQNVYGDTTFVLAA